jgi:glycosyltransferase involved in cell wall biosynthesis
MTGAVEYHEMPDVLSAADFYVTASVTEVHPLAIIEAMAVGLPVAASRSPGIIDSVEHGVSGFLTSKPESGLSAAIVALATNAELRGQMGRSALQASKNYDINHTVARSVDLYDRLLAQRPDLKREQKHGRWYRPHTRLKPRLRDIVRKIGLDEDDPDYLDGQISDD